jgi:hypothetical protein
MDRCNRWRADGAHFDLTSLRPCPGTAASLIGEEARRPPGRQSGAPASAPPAAPILRSMLPWASLATCRRRCISASSASICSVGSSRNRRWPGLFARLCLTFHLIEVAAAKARGDLHRRLTSSQQPSPLKSRSSHPVCSAPRPSASALTHPATPPGSQATSSPTTWIASPPATSSRTTAPRRSRSPGLSR